MRQGIFVIFFSAVLLISGCGKNPVFMDFPESKNSGSGSATIFEDFESYATGTFNGAGVWNWHDLMGEFSIDDSIFYSGSKSLKITLKTSKTSSGQMYKYFTDSTSDVVTACFNIKYSAITDVLTAGFMMSEYPPMCQYCTPVYFGIIHGKLGVMYFSKYETSMGILLYTEDSSGLTPAPNIWYSIRLTIDTAKKTWTVQGAGAPIKGTYQDGFFIGKPAALSLNIWSYSEAVDTNINIDNITIN